MVGQSVPYFRPPLPSRGSVRCYQQILYVCGQKVFYLEIGMVCTV